MSLAQVCVSACCGFSSSSASVIEPFRIVQARSDLLLADAAASRVASLAAFKDAATASRVAESIATARAEQAKRFRVASVLLIAPRPSAVGIGAGSSSNAAAVVKGKDVAPGPGPVDVIMNPTSSQSQLPFAPSLVPLSTSPGFPTYTPAYRWWDESQLPAFALADASASTPATSMGLGTSTNTAEDGPSENSIVSNVILGPTGSLPGRKPIVEDCAALGIVVPGCPLGVTRWKARVITALCRALKRGVALGAVWLVESAAKRLWNRHLHVWSSNEYSLSVMPLLLAAAAEALSCLSAVGSGASELCTKLGAAVARAHEESA
jgi:hypothetical protein